MAYEGATRSVPQAQDCGSGSEEVGRLRWFAISNLSRSQVNATGKSAIVRMMKGGQAR